jgi:hypothetical protein
MPYIKKDRRYELNEIVELMIEKGVLVDGDLNYILFKFCRDAIAPSYNNYKNFLGELNECAAEIRRRMLAPYEDIKIVQNGDV